MSKQPPKGIYTDRRDEGEGMRSTDEPCKNSGYSEEIYSQPRNSVTIDAGPSYTKSDDNIQTKARRNEL